MQIFFNRVRYIALLLMTVSAFSGISRKSPLPNHFPVKAVVLLELFTSQGCSSCPQADALLAEYANAHDRQIIPISFHVDYWNRLGWTDPFSSPDYSARQQWYSRYLPQHSVYTPQLVINGKYEMVGNNRVLVKAMVEKEKLLTTAETMEVKQPTILNHQLSIQYTTNAVHPEDQLLNMAIVQKQSTTYIKAGENKGTSITNYNIVRSFASQPNSREGKGMIALPPAYQASEYALVMFIQNKKGLAITTAIYLELP